MDMDALAKGVDLFARAIGALKGIKELIPHGEKKRDIEQKLDEAERQVRIAEAEIAKGFDYQICRRHFPPGILLDIGPFKSKCSMCGNIEDYEA